MDRIHKLRNVVKLPPDVDQWFWTIVSPSTVFLSTPQAGKTLPNACDLPERHAIVPDGVSGRHRHHASSCSRYGGGDVVRESVHAISHQQLTVTQRVYDRNFGMDASAVPTAGTCQRCRSPRSWAGPGLGVLRTGPHELRRPTFRNVIQNSSLQFWLRNSARNCISFGNYDLRFKAVVVLTCPLIHMRVSECHS